MKLIIAIIQPSKLEDVKAALTDVEVFRLTVMDCQGFGRQKGHTEMYRGTEYAVDFVPKAKLEIILADEKLQEAIDAVLQAAQTGNVGDGKIFVSAITESSRILTGERGADAS